MEDRSPLDLLGAIGGAVGAVPLVAVVRDLASRFLAPPVLPGALRQAADIKAATYLEAAVFLLAIPAAALLFGVVLPRLLESRRGRRPPLTGFPGALFALSAVAWRLGAAPVPSLAAGALAAAGLAAALLLLRDGPPGRRFFEEPNRSALVRIAAAGLAWGLAGQSVRFHESSAASELRGALLLAAAALSLSAFRKTRRRRRAAA
jgi:hypothetical protein